MGMSASQARLLSLTARLSDLEYQAQSISNSKIRLADEGAQASREYEAALDKKIMKVENGSNGTFSDASVASVATYNGVSLSGTNSKFRYITDVSGKLVMTAGQAKSLGFTNTNIVRDANTGTYTLNGTFRYDTVDDFLNAQGNNITKKTITDTSTVPATTRQVIDENSQSYKYYSDLYTQLSNKNNDGDNQTPQVIILSDAQASDPEWLSRQIKSGNVYLSEFNPTGGSDGSGSFDNVSWTSGDMTIHEETDSTEMARAEAKYETTMADINAKDKRFDLELRTIDTEHQAIQTEMDSVKKVIDKNIERSFKIFQA